MKITKEIEKRIENKKMCSEYDKYTQFWSDVNKIITDNKHHLHQITSQLHNYDLHDETHCDKVLENMELLLEHKMEELTFYELVLLYLSANLHDCAMALPNWEYKLLSSVEGTITNYDPKNVLRINNDLQPPKTLRETLEFINQHKDEIYGDFEVAKRFIFAIKEEEKFQKDLAKRVIDYENFRNKYATELNKRIDKISEYLYYSELLRTEYIRSTHHIRATCYIDALKNFFAESLGNTISLHIITCLSQICCAHGENDEYVFSLENNKRIGDEFVNVQFLSIILRMSDAIHFSSDRAPLSLYAEKLITDPVSMQHWKAKFQDLKYEIVLVDGMTEIKFFAFCENPQIYYFILRYINWVDYELNNYHKHFKHLQMVKSPYVEKYNLPLALMVDRSNIIADEEKFIPDPDLKFTLEQDKILNLLMGVQLYKDKYLCLRELYQNSLDACRCMLAENSITSVSEEFCIRFGILSKNIDGSNRKILYCLDNGTGMTRDIVKNHLLKIGNSYYKSKSFSQQNTNWMNKVKPTSQFGIGILSCYMIADKIEVVTRHYSNTDEIFCLNMDGVSENSYYVKPDDIEAEMVGRHGTLVKLYLKQEIMDEITEEVPEKLPYFIHGIDNNHFKEDDPKIIDNLHKSLFYLINRQVGLVPVNISVEIEIAQDEYVKIIPWDKIFDYRNYLDVSTEDVEKLWCDYHYLNGNQNPYKEVIKCREYIEDIPIVLTNNNIDLYTHISLPLLNIPTVDYRIFHFHKFIWNSEGKVLVDGICVGDTHNAINYEYEIILKECLINYIGQDRPMLSIDRSSIVSISDTLKEQTASLINDLPKKLAYVIQMHIKKHNISLDSIEARLCIESIIQKFPSLSTNFIYALSQTEASSIIFKGIVNSTSNYTIGEMILSQELDFNNLDMRRLSEMEREIIVGKLIPSKSITINNCDVKVLSEFFSPLQSYEKHIRSLESLALSTVVIKADKWDGCYYEYDLVSNLWPIVSPNLFEHCIDRYEISDMVQGRSKEISSCGNSLSGIAQLDPVMIHPRNGIFTSTRDPYAKKAGYVGERGTLQENYWLFELNNHGDMVHKEKKDYVLFVFISPRNLNDYEQERLVDYEADVDYIKGVKEGWSILFIGHEQKYYIKPGIATRDEMYALIPESIRKNKLDNVIYFDTTENIVF